MGANTEKEKNDQLYSNYVVIPGQIWAYYNKWGQLRGFFSTPERAKEIFAQLQKRGIGPCREGQVVVGTVTEGEDYKPV